MVRNRVLHYNPKLKLLARELRKKSVLSEVLLWREIKNKRFGVEFHRQVPIADYIVDFFCHERMLAVEIDGCSHDRPDAGGKDVHRQERLEALGVRFLRFEDTEVKQNMRGVLEKISFWLDNDN